MMLTFPCPRRFAHSRGHVRLADQLRFGTENRYYFSLLSAPRSCSCAASRLPQPERFQPLRFAHLQGHALRYPAGNQGPRVHAPLLGAARFPILARSLRENWRTLLMEYIKIARANG